MAAVVIYSTHHCGYCSRAKQLFERKQVAFTEIMVDQQPAERATMVERSGRRTVPQIFIGERHVGGFEELYALERSGELDALIAS